MEAGLDQFKAYVRRLNGECEGSIERARDELTQAREKIDQIKRLLQQ